MSGVEILSSEVIYNSILPEWLFSVGSILAMSCLILCIVFFVEGSEGASCISLCIMVCGILIAVFSVTSDKDNINYIKYKVTISDEVSLNEFFDKYEIIDQEGKVYTVREIE